MTRFGSVDPAPAPQAEPFDVQLERLRMVASESHDYAPYPQVIAALTELLRRYDVMHNAEVSRTCQGCRVKEPRAFFVQGQRRCEACYNSAVGE